MCVPNSFLGVPHPSLEAFTIPHNMSNHKGGLSISKREELMIRGPSNTNITSIKAKYPMSYYLETNIAFIIKIYPGITNITLLV